MSRGSCLIGWRRRFARTLLSTCVPNTQFISIQDCIQHIVIEKMWIYILVVVIQVNNLMANHPGNIFSSSLKAGSEKIFYWLHRFSILLGFYYVKKTKRFVISSSDKSSERNLACFFDMIKPRRIKDLKNQ